MIATKESCLYQGLNIIHLERRKIIINIKIVKLEFLIKLLKNIPCEIPVFSKMILGQSKGDW